MFVALAEPWMTDSARGVEGGTFEVMSPGNPAHTSALCCGDSQALHMLKDDSGEMQAAGLARCSCSLVLARPRVLGCEALQGLVTARGDAPARARTKA